MLLRSLNFLISRYVSWFFSLSISLSSSVFSHRLMDTVEGLGHLEHNNEHVTYLQKPCHKISHTAQFTVEMLSAVSLVLAVSGPYTPLIYHCSFHFSIVPSSLFPTIMCLMSFSPSFCHRDLKARDPLLQPWFSCLPFWRSMRTLFYPTENLACSVNAASISAWI